MKFASLVCALILLIAVSLVPSVSARANRGTDIEGIITAVDHAAQSAELAPSAKGDSFRFSWDAKTTFLEGARPADAAILTRGAKVRLRYEKPLFGKTIVSKVALIQPAAR